MNPEQALHIESILPDDALVIDVGGGAAASPRADWIIDALPFEQSGKLLKREDTTRQHRYRRETWVQFDLCSRQQWPFADKQFDFAICSHVLEDVRDPIWICNELSRVAKAGYVEVPSRVVEQSKGIEHPRLAGYYHHRWLVSVCDQGLEFRHKPHLLHVTHDAIVAKVGFWKTISPQHQITTHYWTDALQSQEILEFDEDKAVQELCEYSRQMRAIPGLLVKPEEPLARRLRKAIYHCRLTWR